MHLALLLILCLAGNALAQIPIRIRSISTPNRFDFSQMAVATDSGALLLAGVDYLIRVGSDFDQSTITNAGDQSLTVNYVGYSNGTFIVCFRESACSFFSTDDIITPTGSITGLLNSVSPLSAEFGLIRGLPAVFIAASRPTGTRYYSLFAYQLNDLSSATKTLVGSPIADVNERTLIISFRHQTRLFFLYRYRLNSLPDPTVRLLTLCDNPQDSNGAFISLVEIAVAGCVSGYDYLSSARVLTLQDGVVYLVLVYRTVNSGTGGDESKLCILHLDNLNSFIDASFNTNAAGLAWSPTFRAVTSMALTSLIGVCSLTISGTAFIYSLLMPASGQSPTDEVLSLAYPGTSPAMGRLTSLSFTRVDSYSYLYVGTANGVLIKYLVNSTSIATDSPLVELESRQLSATLRGRVSNLEVNGDILYALTPRELFRVPLEDCGRHTTCYECVSDSDPLCGWCGIQNVCNRVSQCENSNLTNRWISGDVTACFSIESVTPNLTDVNFNTNVSISAANLPQLAQNNTYLCVYGSLGNTTVSEVSSGSLIGPINGPLILTCPMLTSLPDFTISVSRTFNFSLSSSEFPSTSIFREFEFTLFDCGFHSTCDSCVSLSNTSQCGWCAYSGKCTYTQTLCPAFNRSGQLEYDWVTDNSCPVLTTVNNSTNSFAVENMHTITLHGSNLPAPMENYAYQCSLNVSGSVTNISADYVSSSSLSCTIPPDTISIFSAGVMSAVISVTLSTTFLPFLSPTVSVYNCSQHGDTCSQCLISRQQSADQCGWCDEQSVCTTTQLCSGMLNENSCPDPIISSVLPPSISAQYEGDIRIVGEHLGTPVDEVTAKSVTNQFSPSATFNCMSIGTTTQNIGREHSCRLMGLRTVFSSPGDADNTSLSLTAGDTPSNAHPFYIAFPVINSVVPSFGPVDGGTRVRVSGVGLGVGLTRSADIVGSTGVLANCTGVTSPSSVNGNLECVTDSVVAVSNGQFRVTIDGSPFLSTTGLFEFRANPTLQSISPTAVIRSASLNVTFTGSSLDAAANPIILFPPDTQPKPCIATSETELICLFPSNNSSLQKRQVPGISAVNFTLVFDGFIVSNPLDGISRIPDPTFTMEEHIFPESIQGFNQPVSDSIFLNLLPGSPDYSQIGLSNLFIVELVGNQEGERIELNYTYQTSRIVAMINKLPVDSLSGKSYTIEVSLGEYKTTAGTVTVLSSLEALKDPLIGTAAGIVAFVLVGAVICLLLCLCLCYFRHTGQQAGEEVKQLLLEMDTIENRVAQACRTGFAELTSELGEASDLTQGTQVTTPFLSFHRFLMNIMFPGQPDHSVLHPVHIPPNKDEKEFRKALDMFYDLLRDKDYFLSLVSCIESNRSFSLRDRSNIASLFALCMHDDIEYLTAVLKTLLADLTERMISHSRAKLMFRRTESVAEKLLADWLALLMYGYLVDGAGPAIHMAFRATKRQTEKGPVDVFTGEAKYCLAEDKILRQLGEVEDVQEVDVEVLTEEGPCIHVKLLECDTISQVKLKIMDSVYHSVPTSQRPHLTELDLEVHSSHKEGPGLILRDRDHTSVVSGEWRRVNTLKHYGTFSMLFKLVPRTQKAHAGQELDYVGTLIQDHSVYAESKRGLLLEEKIWHLTKPQDQSLATAKSKKLASEIYLMRLISTKNILQKYVDDMVNAIFPDVSTCPHLLPPPIKFLFDFLEKQAEGYDIDDVDDVIRLWKNNSVPLRFWVTLIKNPDYLFDVTKSETVDSNLAVIAQVFIDSCLRTDSQVTKDAQTTKILYNKEVPIYREKILSFYTAVSEAPTVSEEDLFTAYQVPKGGEHFYRESALQALYSYAHSCKDKLLEEMLDDGRFDQQVSQFEEICDLLSKHSKQ